MAENTIDLFGKSTLTPRQVIQQQLAKSVSNTESLYKDAAPVNRAAAIWGSGLGGLFRQVLQEKGIIEKDPEVQQAEKMQTLIQESDKATKEKNLKFGTPEYFEYVAGAANEAGMPEIGIKAIQYRDLAQAAARKKDLDEASLVTEKGKPALQEAQADEAKAKAAKARDEIGDKKLTHVPQYVGDGKWQDIEIDQKGRKTNFGNPYSMTEKSKSKGESQSPTWNTGLRAFNSSFNYSDLYGLKDPAQLPAYNTGLVKLSKLIDQGIDPLEAASRAASESQSEHKRILETIKTLRKEKRSKEEIEKMLKDANLDPKMYLK